MLATWNSHLQTQQFWMIQANVLLIYVLSIFWPHAYPGMSPHEGRHFGTFYSLWYLQCLEHSGMGKYLLNQWMNLLNTNYLPYTLLHGLYFIAHLFPHNILITIIL